MEIIELLKKWFASKGATASQMPPLPGQGAELEAYETWKRTIWQQGLRLWLLDQYRQYAHGAGPVDGAVHFLCCKTTKGFTWRFDPDRWSPEDFLFMFAFLREQATRLGYTEARSESGRDACHGSGGDFFHRSLLRANGNNQENRFGDILLCLAEQNGKVHSVKFSATACREPDCACESRFGELIRRLLQ
jgi:hypothetical protein